MLSANNPPSIALAPGAGPRHLAFHNLRVAHHLVVRAAQPLLQQVSGDVLRVSYIEVDDGIPPQAGNGQETGT